jgi:serine/threonine protein kinase/tetratricopeptide (TPR) repeat protein
MSTLSPDQWQALSPYLDDALAMTDDARATWLSSLREQDPVLGAQLQEFLDEHRMLVQEGFLETGSPAPPGRGLAGQTIGPYTLISQIGQGGMGSVWLAQRSDGRFERQAAIKFVSIALAGRAAEERFKREGSLLGRLTHPHIAELLDAGVSSTGQPYLILEYVDGTAIDQYADEHKLDIDARIRLFLDVLAAVSHAHSNLIVHRDIKPSNVLVSREGQVKLLDFGIAKLLEAEGQTGAATLLTHEAGSALTPQYAAPEQLTGRSVTTATDVYALGVLLYLILTGQHPVGPGLHSPAELMRAIVETEPERASNTIAPAHEKTIAAMRGTTPEKLQRQLRGDLDTIVSHALKKNPHERYASVSGFAGDLRCYLKQEPISARQDTLAYRTGKFLRRNRAAVTLTATALALVIGSLSGGLYVANRERRIAERRFVQVRQLANKFIELDNDIRGLPGSTHVRMRMVSDSLQYLTLLGSDVHGDSDLALEIAYAYVRVAHAQGDPTSPNLGQFAEAEASLNDAARFVDPVLLKDPKNPRALFIATTIAHDRMVLSDYRSDRDKVLRDAPVTAALIERFMNTNPVKSSDLYSMRYFYSNVGDVYSTARRFDEAARYCQRALDIPLLNSRRNDLRGAILSILGFARWQSGDLDHASRITIESIEFKQAEAAEGHASLLMNLANGYDLEGMILGRADAEPSLGRSKEALANFEKSLHLAETLAQIDANDYLGRHHVAIASLEIGNILRHMDARKALSVYDHALVRVRESKANLRTQRDEAELLVGSSYPLRWAGDEKQAKQRIEKAFELLQVAKRYPIDKVEPMSDTYDALRAQADNYAETGQTVKAIEAYQQMLDKLMAWEPDVQNDLRDATCISRTWSAIARLLRRVGRHDEAARLEKQRMDLWNLWMRKLPNGQFLFRQSLSQITPGPTLRHR